MSFRFVCTFRNGTQAVPYNHLTNYAVRICQPPEIIPRKKKKTPSQLAKVFRFIISPLFSLTDEMIYNYLRAREFLEEGRLVLFTGTPCQIGGLKAYLNKEYENLICQDIICHGVPSLKVWQKYIHFREATAQAKTGKIVFRDKTQGWKTYSVAFSFMNGKTYKQPYGADLYMRGFLQDLCLRPSCYRCAFKTKYREADITLADFWGIQHVLPAMDDDRGTSLVIVHTAKGTQLFDAINCGMNYAQVDLDLAIKYNPSMIQSVLEKPQRRQFMSEMQKRPFDKVVKKYCPDKISLIARIKRKLKTICDAL